MKRLGDLLANLLWALAVLAALGYVALTRAPEAPLLDRLAGVPWIGAASERLRAPYLEARAAARERGSGVAETAAGEAEVVVLSVAEPLPRSTVWLREGARLRQRPRRGAEILTRAPGPAKAPVFERRRGWVEVRAWGRRGWVTTAELFPEDEPPLGNEPLPPRPLPGRPPDAERLAAARALFAGEERVASLGDYVLYTDASVPDLLTRLDRVAHGVEAAYRRRFGLAPVGAVAEAVLLYRREADYRRLLADDGRLAGIGSSGHAGYGMVASFVERRDPDAIAGTLVHEITHLLNRRALGPALPPWLDEGLAEDLAQSRIDAEGRIVPATLAGGVRRSGNWLEWSGAQASSLLVRSAIAGGSMARLERLVGLDWEGFVARGEGQLNYAASLFWIRYLLDEADVDVNLGFRRFLTDVAAGEPATPAALAAHLGRPWAELDADFQSWAEGIGALVAITGQAEARSGAESGSSSRQRRPPSP